MHLQHLSRLDSLDLIKHGSSIDVLENVPTFLSKTYQILQNTDYSEIVSWTRNGEGFIVKKVKQFSEKILPLHFRHSNYSSFVRQLNMYDFHKMRQDNQQNAFKNTLFKKGQKHLLKEIQRKDYKKNKDVRLQLSFRHEDGHRKRKSLNNQNMLSKELDMEIQSSKIFESNFSQGTKSLVDLLNFEENMLNLLSNQLDQKETNVDEMVDIIMRISSINSKFQFGFVNSYERLNNFLFVKYLKWNSLIADEKSKEKGRATQFPSWASIISSTLCGSSKIVNDF